MRENQYILYMSNLTSGLTAKESNTRLPLETILRSLDYVNSNDPAEVDKGIRDTIKGIRLSILAMGLGLAKIKSNRLFTCLNFKNMSMYINGLSKDYKLDRSSIVKWLRIGEAYSKYKNELEMIGFCDRDGPTKLPYLERALAVREKQDVFDSIKNMSVRDFKDFSKGELKKSAVNMPYVMNKGNVVYIEGRRAVIINKELEHETAIYIQTIIKVACEALEKEGLIVPVFVQTRKDARRFALAAERVKVKLGMK